MTLRVQRCELDLTLLPQPRNHPVGDAPGRIEGACTLRLHNQGRRTVSRVHLLLYRLLRVTGATQDGNRALALRQSVRHLPVRDMPNLYVNRVSLALAEDLGPGQETDLHLRYAGALVGYRELFPYAHDAVHPDIAVLRPESLFYPVVGPLSLEGLRRAWSVPAFRVEVRHPADWTCLLPPARGVRLGDGATAFESADEAPGLHLFAAPYTTVRGEGVLVHHRPGHQEWAQAVSSAALFARSTLQRWLGPAPAAGPVEIAEIPPGWGSQHLPGLIAQCGGEGPEQVFRDVAHEVCHFWTPSPCADPHRFCDESIAHYLEDLLVGERAGGGRGDDALLRHAAVLRERPGAVRTPLASAADGADVDIVSRHKGPVALAALERAIGKERMFGLLGSWARDPGAAGADAGAFAHFALRALRDVQAWDIGRFLDDWFFTEQAPFDPDMSPGEALDLSLARYRTAS